MEYNDIEDYSIKELSRKQVMELLNNLDIKPLLVFIEKNTINIEVEIKRIFNKMGLPSYLKGYNCLLKAILITIHNDCKISMTKKLYPLIANELHVKPIQVEKNIRKAIEVIWTNIDPIIVDKLFGYTINALKDHPTNSHFILTISKYISKKYKTID